MQNIWINKKNGITTDEVRAVARENGILPETALILLKPQKLSDQYAFLTEKGISILRFLGGENV